MMSVMMMLMRMHVHKYHLLLHHITITRENEQKTEKIRAF